MNNKLKLKDMILMGVFAALCAVFAYIKIPVPPITTLAFDSLPGFVAAVLINPIAGGFIGALGHFFTALYSGFPFGVVSHIIVMFTMFITMTVFGWIYRKGHKLIAVIAAILLNGPISLIPFVFILGWGIVLGMVLPLTIAAAVNVLIAVVIIPVLQRQLDKG